MSLQGLISGSECALPANPLSQVLKHTEGDRSVQMDRVGGPSSSGLRHLPPTAGPQAAEHDLAFARQFFENQPSSPGPAPMGPQFGPMDLRQLQPGPLGPASPGLQEAWGRSGSPGMMNMGQIDLHGPQAQSQRQWAADFQREMSPGMPQMSSARPAPGVMEQNQTFQSQYGPSSYYAPQTSYMNNYSSVQPQSASGKGKGKLRDVDLEAAFAQFHLEEQQSKSSARIEEVKEGETLETMQAIKGKEKEQESEPFGGDFEKVWKELQSSSNNPPVEDMAKWEAQFNQLMDQSREDEGLYDYGKDMQDLWERNLPGETDYLDDDAKYEFDEDGIPKLDAYVFEQNNPYTTSQEPPASLLAQAKAILQNNGSLTEAALLLEACIQKGELGEGGYEAWILLGETRSMDEREVLAMRALREGVRRVQDAGGNGQGMLSLAICYTNEGFERATNTTLLRYILARFSDVLAPALIKNAVDSLKRNAWASNEAVTKAYLAVARAQHEQGVVDPDVQMGLGVLYYSVNDYMRAKDCFESALSVSPRNYLLWNRLGSSLSNGNKPEDALGAYREALNLRPTYTRAIYNVGVACLNIGAYKEAAEHFLSALTLQDVQGQSGPSGSGEKSEQLWFTLKRALIAMKRDDLANSAKSGADLSVFRREGFDF